MSRHSSNFAGGQSYSDSTQSGTRNSTVTSVLADSGRPSPSRVSSIPFPEEEDHLKDFGFGPQPGPRNYPPIEEISKRVDRSYQDYQLIERFQYAGSKKGMKRPGFYSGGKIVPVEVNCFKVEKLPSLKVFQYDVSTTRALPSSILFRF